MSKPGRRTPSPENVRLRVARRLDDGFQPSKEPKLSGYDLIAAKLGQGELPPVFRRFQKSNFRMLLQLQDEISEMEDELAALDLEDSKSRFNADGSTSPASRRISWEWTQSDLQARRLDVLGRLYIKIEQYCRWPPPLTAGDADDNRSSSPGFTEGAEINCTSTTARC